MATALSKTKFRFFEHILPCSMEQLTKEFRKQAKNLHPDVCRDNPLAGKMFDLMSIEYKLIQEIGYDDGLILSVTSHEGIARPRTVCGKLLSTLGLGLGPTKNGKDCPQCLHDGYLTSYGRAFDICIACDEYGKVQRGKIKIYCPKCSGTKAIWSDVKSKPRYDLCPTCGGTGEIQVFNPVLVKGSLR